MKRVVLILVSADPRESGRAAEAVRVAAGLSVHDRLSVTLCLRGEATRVLAGDPEDYAGGWGVSEFLQVLDESGGRVVAIGNEPGAVRSGVRVLTETEFEREVSAGERVIVF